MDAAEVLVVVYDGVQLLDAAGPVEVFDGAARALGGGGYRRLAAGARRAGSVCTGAFVPAGAGLLEGRRATTHWAFCAELARAYPAVRVDPPAGGDPLGALLHDITAARRRTCRSGHGRPCCR
jgi:transcriptional regulator GlxA family with amidase domain